MNKQGSSSRPVSILLVFLLICFSPAVNAADYFQQMVDYKINVRLNDIQHELHGNIQVTYKNHSPDTLTFIWFHLWPNGYKNNNTALAKQLREDGALDFYYSDEKDRGYIDSLDFKVGGISVAVMPDSQHIDVVKVMLPAPLPPGGRAILTTPFHVKLPLGKFSRLGHVGQTYQVTQWYPKPAVYDRTGWHPMPYLNQGEFYSEFGSFDVSITLPANYVVGATGDLFGNPKEKEFLQKRIEASDSLLRTSERLTIPESWSVSDTAYKTLRFFQKNVHDFAWFANKEYLVQKGEVELPVSQRKVSTWAMFTAEEAHNWRDAVKYINNAVYYYSLWNREYPYDHATGVDAALAAGGGMEYPNVTVIGKTGNPFMLELVLVHEVGHNWFYGILASNERDDPWLDEGLNSFNENRYMQHMYPAGSKMMTGGERSGFEKFLQVDDLSNKTMLEAAYEMLARNRLDQPVELRSDHYTMLNYGAIVYEKTAWVFRYLQSYLGEELFDLCMKDYFDNWKFKHPGPDDLRYMFELRSQKNLAWFFDEMINSSKRLDYKAAGIRRNNNGFDLTVKNKAEASGPFPVTLFRNDSILSTQWFPGISKKGIVKILDTSATHLVIDAHKDLPDINRRNNRIRTSGLFKGTERLQLKLLGSAENPNRSQLYWAPLIGWNEYDGWMPGLAFYNSIIPQKKFEYVIAPMFGTESGTVTGFATAGYNIVSPGWIRRTWIGINAKRFSEFSSPLTLSYNKIAPEITFHFRKSVPRSLVSQSLRLRSVNIIRDYAFYSALDGKFDRYTETSSINEAKYTAHNKDKLSPWKFSAALRQHRHFTKGMLEAEYRHGYARTKGIEIRLFNGMYFYNTANAYGFDMTGRSDEMYDALYFDRNGNTGFAAQQTGGFDGGFRNSYSMPAGNEYLTAINLMASFPVRIPFRVYADAGITEHSTSPEYDAGIAFTPIPGIFEVYFPLAMAKELRPDNYGEKIRFAFHINLLNPYHQIYSLIE